MGILSTSFCILHYFSTFQSILSRSRDELHLAGGPQMTSPEPDQWFAKEKLYKDHIVEVLSKWDNIDDEIWAKVSCTCFLESKPLIFFSGDRAGT